MGLERQGEGLHRRIQTGLGRCQSSLIRSYSVAAILLMYTKHPPIQLYTISSEAMTVLTKPDSSPTVVKKMNLPVAAKLVNF